MMRLCNCNFATNGVEVQTRPKNSRSWTPNWHDWDVCWRKGGPMSLWVGPDGFLAPTLGKAGNDSWEWLLRKTTADGHTPAVVQGSEHSPTDMEMMDAFGAPAESDTYVHLNGVGYVLVLSTATHKHWMDMPNGNAMNPNNHNQPHTGGHADTWCGFNPDEPFIVPPGTRIGDVPVPTDKCRVCYIPGLFCTRLLLVQNAMFNTDGSIDFHLADIKMLGHDANKGPGNSDSGKLLGKDRDNGIRPLHYVRGAGRSRAVIDHEVCGRWDMDDFFFPPLDNAADPLARTDEPDPENTKSPVFAPFTAKDGICHPDTAQEYDDFTVDWPHRWPSYVFAEMRYRKSTESMEFAHRARYWNAKPDAANADMRRVVDALSNSIRGCEAWGEEILPDDGREGDPVRYTIPFKPGTAFDMVLAVRTWGWKRYTGVLDTEASGPHTSHGGAEYENTVYKWKKSGGRGYMNTQFAGYIYQLAAARPKGAA